VYRSLQLRLLDKSAVLATNTLPSAGPLDLLDLLLVLVLVIDNHRVISISFMLSTAISFRSTRPLENLDIVIRVFVVDGPRILFGGFLLGRGNFLLDST
jgi:hypothetical protein